MVGSIINSKINNSRIQWRNNIFFTVLLGVIGFNILSLFKPILYRYICLKVGGVECQGNNNIGWHGGIFRLSWFASN